MERLLQTQINFLLELKMRLTTSMTKVVLYSQFAVINAIYPYAWPALYA